MLLIWKGFLCFESKTAERQRNGASAASGGTACAPAAARRTRWTRTARGFRGRCWTASTCTWRCRRWRTRNSRRRRRGRGRQPWSRVERARALQRERLKGSAIYCNAQMGAREVREYCRHDEGARACWRGRCARSDSRRAATPGAESCADDRRSGGRAEIGLAHIAEAIQYRERPRAAG